MSQRLESLLAQKEALQEAIEIERKRVAKLMAMPQEKQLAIALHDATCKHNHTDACSWYYEMTKEGDHGWEGPAHSEYLDRAAKLYDYCQKTILT